MGHANAKELSGKPLRKPAQLLAVEPNIRQESGSVCRTCFHLDHDRLKEAAWRPLSWRFVMDHLRNNGGCRTCSLLLQGASGVLGSVISEYSMMEVFFKSSADEGGPLRVNVMSRKEGRRTVKLQFYTERGKSSTSLPL